jgi:hypothetical protein
MALFYGLNYFSKECNLLLQVYNYSPLLLRCLIPWRWWCPLGYFFRKNELDLRKMSMYSINGRTRSASSVLGIACLASLPLASHWPLDEAAWCPMASWQSGPLVEHPSKVDTPVAKEALAGKLGHSRTVRTPLSWLRRNDSERSRL